MTKVRKTASTLGAEHHRYSFDQFVLDVDRGALLKNNSDIPLRPKCFRVLKYLVEHHGLLVSKDQLMTAVWPNSVVTEDSLTQCLIKIRLALGDTNKDMVRTVPRRGFLFDVPVTIHLPDISSAAIPTQSLLLENRRPSRWSMAVAAVLALAITAIWLDSEKQAVETATHSKPILPASIAVLSFEDMSPNQDHGYFADGISEEILNLLAQTPELHVIARTSSFAFKGQSLGISEIARRLNVANILEGSVRKEGNKVRITAQLVDATDSSHLWSQTYDRRLDNTLTVQSEIAVAVAAVLRKKLLSEQFVTNLSDDESNAYEHYLKAEFYYDRRASGDVVRAVEQYQKAVEIDPTLAVAWLGLAGSIRIQIANKPASRNQGWIKIKSLLDKAQLHDPNNPELHIRLFHYYCAVEDEDRSRRHFERALQLGQNNALVLSVAAGEELRSGNLDEAIDYQRRATLLDPLGYVNHENLGHYLYWGGQFEEARRKLSYASTLNHDKVDEINSLIGLSWLLQQEKEKAMQQIQELPVSARKNQGLAMIHYSRHEAEHSDTFVDSLRLDDSFESTYYLAEIFAFRYQLDESFHFLSLATNKLFELDPHAGAAHRFKLMRLSPFLKPLKNDARWVEWVLDTDSRIELAHSGPIWRATAFEPNPRKKRQSPYLPY